MNNINIKFGRSLDGKTISYFKGYIDTEDGIILNPSEDQITSLAKQYRVIDEMPYREGYRYDPIGWVEDENGKTVTRIFEEHKVYPSVEEYDQVMEDYIT